MHLNELTIFVGEVLAAVDTGKYDKLGVETMGEAIEEKRVFGLLLDYVPDVVNLPPEETRSELNEAWYSLWNASGAGDFGIGRSGLLLLAAFTIELIQQGRGWSQMSDWPTTD